MNGQVTTYYRFQNIPSNTCERPSYQVTCDLLAAADYFIIQSLKDLCGKVILQEMSLSSCIPAYYLGVKYQCEKLEKGTRDFIHANFVAVAETEDFLNLSKEQILEWISSDEIIVKGEEEVFEVLKKWATRNKSQEQNFNDLFRHLRCIYVPRDYFLDVIVPDPLVKDNLDCSNLALDAMKMMIREEEECYFAQAPRDCLKTHEHAIVACGQQRTYCYIPLTKQWHKLANTCTPFRRSSHSQNISNCQGKLFLIGGNKFGNPAECYDPLLNTWSPLTSFQQRIRFCTVLTLHWLLYIIGGKDEGNNRLSTVQRYNPATNLWQEMPSLSSPRSSVCAVSDGSHLYAIGGNTDNGYVDIAERFDPKEKTWARIAPTLEKRASAAGAAVSEKVFVFGGLGSGAGSVSSSAEMYDPAVNMWSSILSTSAVTPRNSYISAVSFKGKIYVSGDFEPDDSPGIVSKLHIYDIVTREWAYCRRFPKTTEQETFRICSLRIPMEILNTCEVMSVT